MKLVQFNVPNFKCCSKFIIRGWRRGGGGVEYGVHKLEGTQTVYQPHAPQGRIDYTDAHIKHIANALLTPPPPLPR